MCQGFVVKAEVVNRTFSKEVCLKRDQHCSFLLFWQLYTTTITAGSDGITTNRFIYGSCVLKISRNKHTHNKKKWRYNSPQFLSSFAVAHACLLHCCIIGSTDVDCPLKYLHTSSCSSEFYLSTELQPWCSGTLFLAKAFQYSHMKKIWKLEEKLEYPKPSNSHLLEMCIIQYCKDKEGKRLHHTQEGTTKAVDSSGIGFFSSLQKDFSFFKSV